jgi:hypothetical protein
MPETEEGLHHGQVFTGDARAGQPEVGGSGQGTTAGQRLEADHFGRAVRGQPGLHGASRIRARYRSRACSTSPLPSIGWMISKRCFNPRPHHRSPSSREPNNDPCAREAGYEELGGAPPPRAGPGAGRGSTSGDWTAARESRVRVRSGLPARPAVAFTLQAAAAERSHRAPRPCLRRDRDPLESGFDHVAGILRRKMPAWCTNFEDEENLVVEGSAPQARPESDRFG